MLGWKQRWIIIFEHSKEISEALCKTPAKEAEICEALNLGTMLVCKQHMKNELDLNVVNRLRGDEIKCIFNPSKGRP